MPVIYGALFGLLAGFTVGYITDSALILPTLLGGLVGLVGGAIAQKYPSGRDGGKERD